MTNQNQLSQAANAFTLWRENRSAAKSKVPEHLRQQAVSLLAHYPSSKITTALKLSGSQLRTWRQQASQPQPEFIALPTEPQVFEPVLRMAVAFKNGSELRLNGVIPPDTLRTLVHSLISGDAA